MSTTVETQSPTSLRRYGRPLGGLTARQRVFVSEYLVDLNAAAAAMRAGYSPAAAEQTGADLLGNPKIQAAVTAAMEWRERRTQITQDRVLGEIALLAFSDITNYVIDDNGTVTLAPHAPSGAYRAVQSIKKKITRTGIGELSTTTTEVELKLWDKIKPLHLAGQHVNLFLEKMDEARIEREVEKRLKLLLQQATEQQQQALDVTPVQQIEAPK